MSRSSAGGRPPSCKLPGLLRVGVENRHHVVPGIGQHLRIHQD